MINITFVCFGKNFYEFHSEGHSTLNPGNDIVCAGVSALSYALLGTLMNIKDLKVDKEIKDGNMHIYVKSDTKAVHSIANTVFTTIFIGLKQLQVTYPENVKVNIMSEATVSKESSK
jgi:uncharacterized protein YsxB (DUF464 family)